MLILRKSSLLKKAFSVLAAAVICFAFTAPEIYADTAVKDNSKILILHTNDVHCAIENTYSETSENASMGYECVAGEYEKIRDEYSCATLVDAGDNIQGEASGAFSEGEWPLKLMNMSGYSCSAVGNHEFHYGVSRLLELTRDEGKTAEFPYLSCNFISLETGELVYDPYFIQSFDTSEGEKKVAFLGVTTPDTLSSMGTKLFEDENGNLIYSFCEDETGEALYKQIQKYTDAARAEGADYVILLGHLGEDGVTQKWRSDAVAANLTGIDAIIDGHSHEQYVKEVSLKDGKKIPLCQTGVNLKALGEMTIDVKTGEITEEIKVPPLPSDETVKGKVNEINDIIDSQLGKKIGESEVDLYAYEDDGYTWAVRTHETNLGDFVNDAFREVYDTDVSITNGGGIRANVQKGDITKNDMFNVFPYLNDAAVIEATGQQILDALENGVKNYPESNGGFLQVSGITYCIDKSIPSSVKTDASGDFIGVEGEYRVYNVKVGGEPLDTEKTYTVSGISYLLCNGGNGNTMFKGSKNIIEEPDSDIQCLWDYIEKNLNGHIGSEYADKGGQGRITFTDGKTACGKTELSAVANAKSGVRVSWKASDNASGYKVYRKSSAGGSWKLLKTIGSESTLSFIDRSAVNGKMYYYTVKGFNEAGEGEYDEEGLRTVRLSAPSVTVLSKKLKNGKVNVTVKWKKNPAASGYTVYCRAGGAEKKKTLKGADRVSVTFKGMKKKSRYDIQVRTYRTVKGKKYCSACSSF